VPTGEVNGISTLTGNDLFAFLTVVQTTLMALDEAAKYRGVTRRYTCRTTTAIDVRMN
jgi:hypothetical protein